VGSLGAQDNKCVIIKLNFQKYPQRAPMYRCALHSGVCVYIATTAEIILGDPCSSASAVTGLSIIQSLDYFVHHRGKQSKSFLAVVQVDKGREQ